jgi:hypothetical protein
MKGFTVAVAGSAFLGLAGALQAQQFVNGDFASGDFTGWTITPTPNGVTRVQEVEVFELMGPTNPAVNAAKFCVGQAVSSSLQEGIEMTQPMNLTAGVPYDFGFNWAAIRTTGASNAQGGVFSLIVDGVALVTQSAGSTSGTIWHYGRIDSQFTPSTTGVHIVGVRITRPYTAAVGGTVAEQLRQYVGNFTPSQPATPPCYANCDTSTTAPILNVEDFTCFINEFAAAQSLPHEQQLTHTHPVSNPGACSALVQWRDGFGAAIMVGHLRQGGRSCTYQNGNQGTSGSWSC